MLNFTGQTAEQIRLAAFDKWATLAGETAIVGSPEYLMIELISFMSGLNNTAIQQGLEGSLINYALGDRLDEIGILFGISRVLNESDSDYRVRILLAPATYTTAGTEEQIKAIVKLIDQSITDVSATVTTAPNVSVRFITKTGLPNTVLIAKVLAKLQDKKVRPVCVNFSVSAPTIINYTITANITTYADADVSTLPTRCATALNDYIKLVRANMGRDVVVAQIVGVLQNVSGVYKAVVTSPAIDLVILPTEWATAIDATPTSITLTSSVTG
jgi:phage-related baseplate assembly protein